MGEGWRKGDIAHSRPITRYKNTIHQTINTVGSLGVHELKMHRQIG